MNFRIPRALVGIMLALFLSVIYSTGFFYTNLVIVITAFFLGFLTFLTPYYFGFSGKINLKLIFLSFGISLLLFLVILFNAAFRVKENILLELYSIITQSEWVNYSLPAWALLFSGSFLIGLILPPKKSNNNKI
jgi:hypothetical protein